MVSIRIYWKSDLLESKLTVFINLQEYNNWKSLSIASLTCEFNCSNYKMIPGIEDYWIS